MSSATYDAKEKLEAALGTSIDAIQMALRTDPIAKLIWDHSVQLIASLEQNPMNAPKNVVHPETARHILEAGFNYGVDWSQGAYSNKPFSGDINRAKEEAWNFFQQNIPPGPAEPARPLKDMMSPEALKKDPDCNHDWHYIGTDGHGSHKGEDAYKCAKCLKTEYRS